jgi:hypothetical protein
MPTLLTIRNARLRRSALLLLLAGVTSLAARAQSAGSSDVLDRVVAVVNDRAILSSDIADELRFSVLDPDSTSGHVLTPESVLQILISRTLIQQQIRQEDASASLPTDAEVQDRVSEIRRDLPACARQNCASEAGWSAFLASHGLTAAQVAHYVRLRLEILSFIEVRFRQGIRISQDDTEGYYRDKLLPQYGKGATVPSLKEVAPRIEEILLEQQVNSLFGTWLENLRKQGDIEVLDPTLESAAKPSDGSGGAP